MIVKSILEIKFCNSLGYAASGNSRLRQASDWCHVINGGETSDGLIPCVRQLEAKAPFLLGLRLFKHSFKPEEVVILDEEDRWFGRGIREAISERVEQPALNKKGALLLPNVASMG